MFLKMLQKDAAVLWRLHFGGCNGFLPLLAHLTLEIIVVYQGINLLWWYDLHTAKHLRFLRIKMSPMHGIS